MAEKDVFALTDGIPRHYDFFQPFCHMSDRHEPGILEWTRENKLELFRMIKIDYLNINHQALSLSLGEHFNAQIVWTSNKEN